MENRRKHNLLKKNCMHLFLISQFAKNFQIHDLFWFSHQLYKEGREVITSILLMRKEISVLKDTG